MAAQSKKVDSFDSHKLVLGNLASILEPNMSQVTYYTHVSIFGRTMP